MAQANDIVYKYFRDRSSAMLVEDISIPFSMHASPWALYLMLHISVDREVMKQEKRVDPSGVWKMKKSLPAVSIDPGLLAI